MYEAHKIKSLTPLGATVLVSDMNFKERFTTGGIVLLADDGKASGIRPRWAQVYAVGPDQHDVVPGEWICVAHGRWTRGIKIDDGTSVKIIRKIDHKDILMVSDEPPVGDDTISDAVGG
jgi:hypothetical protein